MKPASPSADSKSVSPPAASGGLPALTLLFAVLGALQVAGFIFYMTREVVWSPYMAVDSPWYLYFNYQIVTALAAGEPVPADLVASPQGFGFYLHAALFQWALGANRIGAVSINLFYALVFQGAVMLATWRATRSRAASVIAYGLALMILSPLNNAFGQPNVADFFPDVVMGSVCGTFFCCVFLSDCFRACIAQHLRILPGMASQ